MTRINDGGAAFPRPASEFTKSGSLADGNDAIEQQDGMSLRDYFAGQALASVSIGVLVQSEGNLAETSLAEAAYRIADAMLAARNKKPEGGAT